MSDDDKPIHRTTDEARGGTTPHMTRYILPISLVLVVIIFAVLVLARR